MVARRSLSTSVLFLSGSMVWSSDPVTFSGDTAYETRLVEQRHAYLTRSRRQSNLVPPVPCRGITSVVLRSREIQTDSLLGNQVKRAAWSLAYLAVGVLVSWLPVLFTSRLAGRYAWPSIHRRWHECWDFEHCSVSWLGYAVAFLFFSDRLPLGPSWDSRKQERSPCLALLLPCRSYS